eukprot:295352-Prorocentrum_minimum.AAC.1
MQMCCVAYGSKASAVGRQLGLSESPKGLLQLDANVEAEAGTNNVSLVETGSDMEQWNEEEDLPPLVGPRRRLLNTYLGSFVVANGPDVRDGVPTAVSCVEVNNPPLKQIPLDLAASTRPLRLPKRTPNLEM